MARKRKPSLRALHEGDPRRPRSTQPLLPADVTPAGRRRRDRRDWLANLEDGHPEQKPPLDGDRR
jgi:hypothetical protein